jgi:hypothetical protein
VCSSTSAAIALEQLRLFGRERRPERRHRLLDPHLDEPQRIEVPLHDHRAFRLADRVLGVVQVVQQRSLVEHRGVGGVQVLGLGVTEHAPAEAHHAPAQIVNREEQPVPEARSERAVLPLHRKPGLHEHLGLHAELLHSLEELVPLRCEPQSQRQQLLEIERPLLQVAPCRLRVIRVSQAARIPLARRTHRREQWLPWVGTGAAPFGDGDTDPARHLAHRRRVVHPQTFHEEGEYVSRLVAHEAVEHLFLGNDGEVAVLPAVERAGTAVVGARAPQLHVLPDDRHEVSRIAHLLDHVVGDGAHDVNSAMVTPDPPCSGGAR